MKKLFIPFIAVAVFIVAVGILLQKTFILNPTQPKESPQAVPTVTINGNSIPVEIAKNPQERAKGLSGRDSLDAGSGMLFIFEEKSETTTFWMKGMSIPLDIIWIQDAKIIRIDKNIPAPAPETPDNKLKTYSAGRSVDYVLEVNAGFSDSNSIKIGDSVSISGI